MKKAFYALFASLFLAGCANVDDSLWATPATSPPQPELNLTLTPGTYTGVGAGLYGDIVVEVEVGNDNILAITLLSHNDTPEFAEPVFEELIPLMVKTNSTGVDIMTIASFSSRGLLAAVEDALKEAGADLATLRNRGLGTGLSRFEPGVYTGVGVGGFGGDVHLEVTIASNNIDYIEVIQHGGALRFAEPAFETLITRVMDAQSSNVDVVSGATLTSSAFLLALRDVLGQALIEPGYEQALGDIQLGTGNFDFIPGVYTAYITDGFYGPNNPFTITITVNENTILDIEVEHNDTPMFANPQIEALIVEVLTTQQLDVDVVTTASYTKASFFTTLNNAIAQAEGN